MGQFDSARSGAVRAGRLEHAHLARLRGVVRVAPPLLDGTHQLGEPVQPRLGVRVAERVPQLCTPQLLKLQLAS